MSSYLSRLGNLNGDALQCLPPPLSVESKRATLQLGLLWQPNLIFKFRRTFSAQLVKGIVGVCIIQWNMDGHWSFLKTLLLFYGDLNASYEMSLFKLSGIHFVVVEAQATSSCEFYFSFFFYFYSTPIAVLHSLTGWSSLCSPALLRRQ